MVWPLMPSKIINTKVRNPWYANATRLVLYIDGNEPRTHLLYEDIFEADYTKENCEQVVITNVQGVIWANRNKIARKALYKVEFVQSNPSMGAELFGFSYPIRFLLSTFPQTPQAIDRCRHSYTMTKNAKTATQLYTKTIVGTYS